MANHSSATTHASHVQHHFVDSDQQFDAAKFGMWIFLVTEILFFGGLFAAYIVYRAWYPELFTLASEELNTLWGGVNTLVLIGSSLTVAMAIKSAQLNQKKNIIINLGITIALAFVFMVIKYFEYTHKFEIGIFPGQFYAFEGIDHPKANIFFSLYYLMTGLHGIHVLVGIGLMIWLVKKAMNQAYDSEYYTPLEITGLYWHLVDIIWIFLFPLFYLID
ncbi:cytochrome c oxidase subunit 3 family protein [Balneolaceae bacterium YR4-1]|uniref:Cytochrome c oxidase subunit 3 family protein n=1 Tax=Halalkalibaculum roseum TaxID=2709311 RepID=A0A6M1SVW5_9BACT|nr:cytochrome c oxidase subunit 3 family protein [Halalkalibaculum roseum]NGP77140.1 cytochrome c oxidase subunit 3 family protein [Halalkalibaculum roseum]